MSVEFRAFCAFPEASLTGNTILSQTILKILEGRTDSPDYLHFLGWTHFWGAIFHWIMTTLNCPSRVLVDVIRERDLLSGRTPNSAYKPLRASLVILLRSAAGSLVFATLALLVVVTAFLFKCFSSPTLFYGRVLSVPVTECRVHSWCPLRPRTEAASPPPTG
ncbi:hypothetical protein V8E53_010635 [Lactarius tabidus]